MAHDVTFLGNHGSAQLGEHAFAAFDRPPAAFGYCVAIGKAGGEAIMGSGGLQLVIGRIHLGVFVQAEVSVSLQFTLSADPNSPDAVWGNTLAVAPSNILPINFPFTGMKIKFGAQGGALNIGAI